MARKQGWTVTVALLVGLFLASLFWLYGPYLKGQVKRQVAEALQGQHPAVELSPGGGGLPQELPSSASGSRYQMVSDGKQVFLADLKEGRVWRYFHHTKEGGFAKEDEGFLPVALYYGGKKYYRATEVETLPVPAPPAEPTPAGKAGEKKLP